MRSLTEFLSHKIQDGNFDGFAPLWMPPMAFDFQQHLIEWNLRKAKSATLADCGLGKTLIELAWGENVVRKSNRPVLLLTPLGVAAQTVSEGWKFGIECARSRDGQAQKNITVTNYERLHLFNPNDFAGVICDESSCIKAFNGKRRAQVTEFLRTIPYRLMATATPAPNDYIELGTTSEALGIMGQMDMMGRFFKNDQNSGAASFGHRQRLFNPHMPCSVVDKQRWRFKGHAEIPFFRWVCSWARACRKPSDLGYSDERFVLPPLVEREHIVETRTLGEGMLFALPATNMAEERDERRRTVAERCELAAELTAGTGEPYVIWCHLNEEGDLLERLMKDAVQVSGSDSDEEKEEAYEAFASGQARGMIAKQKIAGWGLNWQHCAHVLEFVSHSFEQHYQGVRRCLRFGQKRRVINDIIATEGEKGVKDNMRRKSEAADRMFSLLVHHMNEAIRIDSTVRFDKTQEVPSWL